MVPPSSLNPPQPFTPGGGGGGGRRGGGSSIAISDVFPEVAEEQGSGSSGVGPDAGTEVSTIPCGVCCVEALGAVGMVGERVAEGRRGSGGDHCDEI